MKKDAAAIQAAAWKNIARILGSNADDEALLDRIKLARSRWTNYANSPQDLAPSRKMKADLQDVADLADELANKIANVRHYAQLDFLLWKNGFNPEDPFSTDPFSDYHIKMLHTVSTLTQHIAEELRVPDGAKGDVPRRFAFVEAATIYEETTGKRATYSNDKSQIPYGDFLDFLMKFCLFCYPNNKHTIGTAVEFCKWLRETRAEGRDPALRIVGLETS